MSRFEVSRHLSVLLAYLIAYYSLLMEWPQPALALRDAIRAHVNGAGVGDTEYGKNMNELAATLNVAAAPAETDNFCGTRRWAHKIDPREAGALGTKIEDVQAAHTKLGEMWKVARIAFYNKAKKPALNAARTAEQRSASNEARTTDQISASNAKTNPARPAAADLTPEKRARKQKSNAAAYEKQKKSEKEQAEARRKSKHEAYHTRVRDVLQANKAAQPLGDVDAATGACACPKNIFCAKCPAEKYAQAKRTIEATELLFHDATNVGCGMELADADLDDLIEKCVKVTDARKIELGKAYDKKIGLGIPLPACASCGLRDCSADYYRHKVAALPDALKVRDDALKRWEKLDQTIELVSATPVEPPRSVNLRQIVSCYADCCGKPGADCQCGCAAMRRRRRPFACRSRRRRPVRAASGARCMSRE